MNYLSILDTRTKAWKEAKTKWNINSKMGREDIIANVGGWNTNEPSIFDPVLTELFYTWYVPDGGSIIDPFAGGSVRGIVADELGMRYTGIDISRNQIEANRLQSDGPEWILGDSQQVLETLDTKYDFGFTCPPYHNLEIYTDEVNDLSNMGWDAFRAKYELIMHRMYDVLKDNRFMAIVVGEIRDASKTRDYKIGKYKNLIGETIKAAESAGFHYYNEFILINPFERASKQMNRYYNKNRKVPSVHQNVLVFIKGNPDIATMDIDAISGAECMVDGIKYRTFREAAICIDKRLVASDIKWRCNSKSYPTYIEL